MPHSYDYDAIVIGSGPGGEGAAMGLVKQGARVAVIERYQNVGGGCTHWGTIPSKACLLYTSGLVSCAQAENAVTEHAVSSEAFLIIVKHPQ